MSDSEKALFWAVVVNSALYLLLAFTAGVLGGNPLAWKTALGAIGFTYCGYAAQLAGLKRWFCSLLVFVSIALGFISGIALLVMRGV